MKKKSSVFDRMTNQAMAKMPPPTIHLRGKHAKAFHGMKPGQKVQAQLHGTLQNTGMDRFADNEPTADISVSRVVPGRQKQQMADDQELE